jgi:hypothetical protein
MAADRLPRFSQRNVLAAINRPVRAPGKTCDCWLSGSCATFTKRERYTVEHRNRRTLPQGGSLLLGPEVL